MNVRDFMSSNSCKIAFANLAVHVPNADNRTWCGAKRPSNLIFFFSSFLFNSFLFLKNYKLVAFTGTKSEALPNKLSQTPKALDGEHSEVSC